MKRLLITASLLALTAVPALAARDQIRVVGSSTVYPFTTAVAEQFGKKTGMKTPVVESTGTGGGMKMFCEGVGEDKPDATNASRRIKKSEFEACAKNGVTDIVEIVVGFDGLTLAQSKAGTPVKTSYKNIFLALAKDVPGADGKMVANPYKMWNEIDPSLPAVKIEVLGPPPTSGTRDCFHELMMEARRCRNRLPEGAEEVRRQGLRGGLEVAPRGRRLCRSRRERQRDRPEARSQSRMPSASSASRSLKRTPRSFPASNSAASRRPSRRLPMAPTRRRANSSST